MNTIINLIQTHIQLYPVHIVRSVHYFFDQLFIYLVAIVKLNYQLAYSCARIHLVHHIHHPHFIL